MRPSRRDIVVATRASRLATVQAEHIGKTIHSRHERVGMRLVPIESEADRIKDHPLASLGGKGLFTRAIEIAVLQKTADLAVHSLKDLPTDNTPGLVLAAHPPRKSVHDVLIAAEADSIADLPQGATVGTCSPRRASQVLRMRPDLRIVPLRGNVETRINKVMTEGVVDATLLAAAGLERLGLDPYLTKPIDVDDVLPAAGQAALAVQCRVDDHTTMRRCMPLNHGPTATAIEVERQIVAALGADCHSPIAALAEQVDAMNIRLRARVLAVDGTRCVEFDDTMPLKHTKHLVRAAVKQLTDGGARELLAEAEQQAESAPA